MNESEIRAGLAQTANYRYAEVVGNHLHVAGQVPRDGAGVLMAIGDPAGQCRQCLVNLFALVEHHGFAPTDIRRVTVYVVGPRQNLLDAWEEVTSAFGLNVPPATLLGVALLGYTDQLVEIDATIERT